MMSAPNVGHTPGPWTYQHQSGTYFINSERSFDFATTRSEGNARLIAAAPEMLAALRETLRALEEHLDSDTNHAGLKHRDLLCPCNQNEVARAKALLSRLSPTLSPDTGGDCRPEGA